MNKRASHEMMMMIGYMLLGAIMILAMSGAIGRMISGYNQGKYQQRAKSFNTLCDQISDLLANQDEFAQSEVTLDLEGDFTKGGAVLVGFSDIYGRSEKLSTRDNKAIIQPDYCSGGCLCLYSSPKSWSTYGKQNKDVVCRDFGAGVNFITDMREADFNYGELMTDYEIPVVSEDPNHSPYYPALVLYGQKPGAMANSDSPKTYFRVREIYLDKQQKDGVNYIYFAIYDGRIHQQREKAISP